MDIVLCSIPLFFLLIALEVPYSAWSGRGLRLNGHASPHARVYRRDGSSPGRVCQ